MSSIFKLDSSKEWFSISELAELSLKGLPKCKRRILPVLVKSLNTDGKRRPLKGKGGGYEYHISSLPLHFYHDVCKLSDIQYQTELKWLGRLKLRDCN